MDGRHCIPSWLKIPSHKALTKFFSKKRNFPKSLKHSKPCWNFIFSVERVFMENVYRSIFWCCEMLFYVIYIVLWPTHLLTHIRIPKDDGTDNIYSCSNHKIYVYAKKNVVVMEFFIEGIFLLFFSFSLGRNVEKSSKEIFQWSFQFQRQHYFFWMDGWKTHLYVIHLNMDRKREEIKTWAMDRCRMRESEWWIIPIQHAHSQSIFLSILLHNLMK